MTTVYPEAARWWKTTAAGTPTELGFVRIDRVGSTADWEDLPREEAIARRAEYLKLVETLAEGFGAAMPLAWQGDGTMIFVADGGDPESGSEQAVGSAAARAGLLAITLDEQLLRSGFTARIAAHAGRVAFDADTGKMADAEIDRAGHLEHDCPPGAASLSEDVYLALPEALRERCAYLGTTTRDGTVAFVFPPSAVARRDPSCFVSPGDDFRPLERRFLRYLDSPDVCRLRYVGFRLRRPDPPSLDLLDVFTPLDVEEHAPSRARSVVDFFVTAEGAGGPSDALGVPWARAPRQYSVPRPFRERVAASRHLVVLGDPGSGKSTLLRWLAVTAGLGRLVSRQRLGVDQRLVPLLLPVGRLFELRRALTREVASGVVTVLDAIVCYFRERNVAEDPEPLRRLLLRRLEEGACLVLLDGLDEAPSEARQDLARWLESFAAAYRETRFVLTSRVFGYAGVSLPGGTTVVLRPFVGEQVRTYLLAWHRAYRAWESNLSPEAARMDRPASDSQAEQLVRIIQGDPRLRALAGNPFLLSAIALVHRAEGQLPAHRVQLYEVFARALCETWDQARRLAAGDRTGMRRIEYETEAIPILGRVAFWLHERHPAGAASEADVREELVAALVAERGVDRRDAEKAAGEFLRRAGEELQILVPRGPGLFGFMHLTFQEFFAAAYLHARERFDAESRLRWYDARWEEVVLLGAGMLAIVQKRPAAASRFVQGILGWTLPRYAFLTEILEKHVCLAARCAADGPNLDVATYEAVGDALLGLVVRAPYEANRRRARGVLRHVKGTRFGALIVGRLVQELPGNPDAGQRAAAVQALGALDDPRAFDVLVSALRQDPDQDVRQHAAEALGTLGDARAIEPLLQALCQDSENVRQAAADALGTLATVASLVPTLAALLKEENTLTRGFAALALGTARARDTVGLLVETLREDPEPSVRQRAAEALGDIGDQRALTPLISALRSAEDYRVRAGAASALGHLGNPAALDDLFRILEDDRANELARSFSALASSHWDDPRIVDVLIAVLRREDAGDIARAGAASALGWLGDPRAVVPLVAALADASDLVRRSVVSLVTAPAADARGWVRSAAAEALGDLGDVRALEPLLNAVRRDREAIVREHAARALGALGDLQALEPLVTAFRDETDTLVRSGIIDALWALSDRLS